MTSKRSAAEPASQTTAKIIKRRMNEAKTKRAYISLGLRVAAIVLVAWVMLTQVFLLTQAQGNGMFPAVKDGDLLVVFRLQPDYVKDDVIVYDAGGKRRVGRVVARESDVVMLDEGGSLTVNGVTQGGYIFYPSYAIADGLQYPYTVPAGCVFVMGDYRTQTEDSRTLGAIPLADVTGKVITVMRRQGL